MFTGIPVVNVLADFSALVEVELAHSGKAPVADQGQLTGKIPANKAGISRPGAVTDVKMRLLNRVDKFFQCMLKLFTIRQLIEWILEMDVLADVCVDVIQLGSQVVEKVDVLFQRLFELISGIVFSHCAASFYGSIPSIANEGTDSA